MQAHFISVDSLFALRHVDRNNFQISMCSEYPSGYPWDFTTWELLSINNWVSISKIQFCGAMLIQIYSLQIGTTIVCYIFYNWNTIETCISRLFFRALYPKGKNGTLLLRLRYLSIRTSVRPFIRLSPYCISRTAIASLYSWKFHKLCISIAAMTTNTESKV